MAAKLKDPFPGKPLSSAYGWRALAGGTFHEGQDYAVALNTPLPALANGVVVEVGETKKFGRFIVIRADNGLFYRWHAINKATVTKGARVSTGQTIALSGATGAWTTGPHAHLQICKTADSNSYIDPRSVLTATGDVTPAASNVTPLPPPKSNGKRPPLMFLAWNTTGSGFLYTPNGRAGVPNPQVWNLLVRLLNSTPSNPDHFNAAEIDMIRDVIKRAA